MNCSRMGFGLALILVVSLSSDSLATLVPVVNHSFETNQIPGDGNTATFADDTISGAPSGWTNTIGGINNRGPGSFFNSRIASTPDPSDSPREQMAWSNGGGYMFQTLSTNLLAGVQYTLTIDIGDRNDTPFGGADIRLGAGSSQGVNVMMPVTSSTPTPADGNWSTWVFQYVALGTTPGVGTPLRIELHSNGVQTLFDNVRLDAQAIPEASPALMLAVVTFGIVGTGLWTRRRTS